MNFFRTSSLSRALSTFHIRLKSTLVKEYDYNAWIFNYFEREEKYSTYKAKHKPSLHVSPVEYHKKPTSQLLCYFTDKNINSKYYKLLDLEISVRIDEQTSLDELLAVANCFGMINRPSIAIEKILPLLKSQVLNENVTVPKVIQILFYLSLLGSKDYRQMVTLASQRVIQNVGLVNKNDIAVFCLSLFSSGVPINDTEVLNKISVIIQDELNSKPDPLFPKLLVCYVKLLRLSKFYDDTLFSVLSDHFRKKGLDEIPFTSMVHIAVYFCDAFYGDVAFIKFLLGQLVEEAERKSNRNENIRLKDIDNLLYSASNYCVPEINKIFQNSLLSDIFRAKSSSPLIPQSKIIDILVWFWILECRIDDVTKMFITPQNISKITGSQFFKDFARLNLLLSCVQAEAPELLDFNVKQFQNNRFEPRLGPYLSKRPHLKKSFEYLQKNKGSFGLSDVQISFQVPGLYIAGIKTFNSNGPINIEIQDESVSLRNSTLPKGQVLLKIRLLKKMGQQVLLIKTNSLNQQKKDLEQILRESLEAM